MTWPEAAPEHARTPGAGDAAERRRYGVPDTSRPQAAVEYEPCARGDDHASEHDQAEVDPLGRSPRAGARATSWRRTLVPRAIAAMLGQTRRRGRLGRHGRRGLGTDRPSGLGGPRRSGLRDAAIEGASGQEGKYDERRQERRLSDVAEFSHVLPLQSVYPLLTGSLVVLRISTKNESLLVCSAHVRPTWAVRPSPAKVPYVFSGA